MTIKYFIFDANSNSVWFFSPPNTESDTVPTCRTCRSRVHADGRRKTNLVVPVREASRLRRRRTTDALPGLWSGGGRSGEYILIYYSLPTLRLRCTSGSCCQSVCPVAKLMILFARLDSHKTGLGDRAEKRHARESSCSTDATWAEEGGEEKQSDTGIK